MSIIRKELLNKEKLEAKISELEENYVAGAFQEFYFPLANKALADEIAEKEAEYDFRKETAAPEELEELKKQIDERKKMVKVNEMQLKSVE